MVRPHDPPALWGAARLAARTFQVALLLSLVGISFRAGTGTPPDSDPIRQVAWLLLGAIAGGTLLYGIREWHVSRPHFGNLPTWLFILFAVTSALWSTAPLVTLKRCVLLLIVLMVCIAVFGRRNEATLRFTAIAAPPLLLLLALSVVYSVAAPGAAFTNIGWRGMATHKNELGQVIAVSLLFLACGRGGKAPAVFRVLLLLALAGALILTRSATSLIALALALSCVAMVRFPSVMFSLRGWEGPLLATLLAALTMLYLAFLMDLLATPAELHEHVLRALGKSENLTGRTEIWNLVLNEVRYHSPFIGGGYGGFWAGMDSVSAHIGRGQFQYPNQAHNGYIDVFNDLGYIGCVLLFLVVASQLRMILILTSARDPEAAVHLALLVFVLVSNYGESTFFRGTQFLNVLHLASLIRCGALMRRVNPVPAGPAATSALS